MRAHPPKTFGPFSIRRTVYENSRNTVYQAYDAAGAPWALKVAKHPDTVDGLRKEAALLGALSHPHIVKSSGLMEAEGHTGLIEEYLPRSLPSLGRRNIRKLVEAMYGICDAVSYLHQPVHAYEGASDRIIHRDIKLENILLDSKGTARLVDFDAALFEREPDSLAADGYCFGTAYAIAPEILLGAKHSPAVDVYGLGIATYTLMTGVHPYDMPDERETLLAVSRGDAPKPSALEPRVSRPLEEAILTALAAEPGKRFASADVFKQALSEALGRYSAP